MSFPIPSEAGIGCSEVDYKIGGGGGWIVCNPETGPSPSRFAKSVRIVVI